MTKFTVKFKNTVKKAILQAVPPKALVNFRVFNAYNGEFGFDWIRMADTGKPGDSWYKTIIGEYRPTPPPIPPGGSATTFHQMDAKYVDLGKEFELVNHPTKRKDKYVVPVASILNGETATFSLKLEVLVEPAKLFFKYDNTLFTLNKQTIAQKTKGKRTLADFLTVTCIKEFGTDKYIEVFADEKFAGKLKIQANDRAHRRQVNIALVNVTTDLTGSGILNVAAPAGRQAELRKYLKQAQITPNFTTLALDLSADATFNTNFATAGGDIANGASDAIQDHLNTALYARYDATQDYRRYYKIYFINEVSRLAGGSSLYGRSYGIPSANRSVVVYAIGFADSTLAHETFHAMGLHHTFSNTSKHTFQKNQTDNIMDYSDVAVPPIPVISTYQWQWSTLRTNSDPA